MKYPLNIPSNRSNLLSLSLSKLPFNLLHNNCTSAMHRVPRPPQDIAIRQVHRTPYNHKHRWIIQVFLISPARALSRTTINRLRRQKAKHISPEMSGKNDRDPLICTRWIYIWNMNGGIVWVCLRCSTETKFVFDVWRVWCVEAECVCFLLLSVLSGRFVQEA